MDLSRAQRTVLTVAGLLVAVAAVIGAWPVAVTLGDGTSYSCGSGFLHSRHTWQVDSGGLAGVQQTASGSATPNSACPARVYGHRDFALLLAGLAILGGGITVALMAPADPFLRGGRAQA